MTFKEYCDTCILSPLTCEIELNCKTKWFAGRKAMLDEIIVEVIETIENRADVFDNDHMYEHGETVKDVAKELRKKYGVK